MNRGCGFAHGEGSHVRHNVTKRLRLEMIARGSSEWPSIGRAEKSLVKKIDPVSTGRFKSELIGYGLVPKPVQ